MVLALACIALKVNIAIQLAWQRQLNAQQGIIVLISMQTY
jgi:hypothetical protein